MSLMPPEGLHTDPSFWTRKHLEAFVLFHEGPNFNSDQDPDVGAMARMMSTDALVAWVKNLRAQTNSRGDH